MKKPTTTKPRWIYYLTFGAVLLLALCAAFLPSSKTRAQNGKGVYTPTEQPVMSFAPINVKDAAEREALSAADPLPWSSIIPAPRGTPPVKNSTVPIVLPPVEDTMSGKNTDGSPLAPPLSPTGSSPGPTKTFQSEFLSNTSIPPDTMGAVGTTHVVNVSNNMMSIMDRNGVELSRVTLSSFWSGIALEGGAAVSAFDPKVLYDRFNSRWILISSANAQTLSSSALFAVSQTNDPTGAWNRYAVDADPTATATTGNWIDYPTIGFNKDWIVVNENTFGYGTGGTGYKRADIYVLNKQAAYNNTLSSISLFSGLFSACLSSPTQETELGCGFTMAPTKNEDDTSNTIYLVEDWDSTAGQLRMSKITGTPSAPVLTVATQFPQSTNSWRFDAPRITSTSGTTVTSSGGYVPQRQQSANLVSGTRIMNNDSRIQNAVLRNGSLWTAHTVMVGAAPTVAGTGYGATNPDIRSAVQWWQIDPTVETGLSTPALQRARIEDPIADNCHNGTSGTRTTGTCTSTATQIGQFFAFPNISVNKNNDVLIGFTQFSALTYPSSAYAIRRSADPINTMRDPAVYRPGQANYNLGSGTSTCTAPCTPSRQNRWGDYSAAQTDPLNDTDFWALQEYGGTVRDFGIGLAGNWETWWAQINPAATAPSTTGKLIISEFRLRGPQGIRDEFVELYNPDTTPVIVNTIDGSDGWALAYSANGTTAVGVAVIPNGTVVQPGGHFLIVDNPDAANGPTVTYSLNGYPGKTNPATSVRGSESDAGWSFDLADNGGLALFKSSNATTGFIAANRMDSVGFAGVAAGLFKEGTGIPAITATTPTGQISFVRNMSSGTPLDTGDNATDFIFVNTNATTEALGSTPRLGAPGPENLDSPINRPGYAPLALIDSTVATDAAPNQITNATPVTNGANGTVQVRRNFTNTTTLPIERLRFHIANLSTFPSTTPDLRLLSSTAVMVTSNDTAVCGASPTPCNVTAQGLTLEAPPTQTNGGGVNSSVTAGTVTFSTPLAVGAKIQVNFLFGVQSGSAFTASVNESQSELFGKQGLPFAPQAPLAFTVITEGTTGLAPLAPTAAAVSVSGRVVSKGGRGVSRAVVKVTSQNGEIATAVTDFSGYYQINNIVVGDSYIFTVVAKGFTFAPRVVNVLEELNTLNFAAGR